MMRAGRLVVFLFLRGIQASRGEHGGLTLPAEFLPLSSWANRDACEIPVPIKLPDRAISDRGSSVLRPAFLRGIHDIELRGSQRPAHGGVAGLRCFGCRPGASRL
jgi:hypothetical protein